MKYQLLGFSLIELMISAGILSGIFYAGQMMIQHQEQGQQSIRLGIERNTAFNFIGKIFQQDTPCNFVLQGHSIGDDVAINLQSALPPDLQKNITIRSALIQDHNLAPVQLNRISPFILDLTASFDSISGNKDISTYRFFLEAKFDGAKTIVFCVNKQVSMLSTICEFWGGDLVVRDVDNDGTIYEVACQMPNCSSPPNIEILDQLYNTNPAALVYPVPLTPPYQDNNVLSRKCFVQYLTSFLDQVVIAPGRYVLQQSNDTITGSLEGTGSANFQTNTDLIARSWSINENNRTLLLSNCPANTYSTGVNVAGNLTCSSSPINSLCTPVCPIASEMCRGFFYDGPNGCGGICNVTGTRPPACINGDIDPNLCFNQTRTTGNGCGGTCLLRGSINPSCPITNDPNVCLGTCYNAAGICGASCNICGTKTTGACAPAASPTPTGPCPLRQPECASWSQGNTIACCASQTWAGPSPCPPTCGTPPSNIQTVNCNVYYEQFFDCTVCGHSIHTVGTPCLKVVGAWGTQTWATNVQAIPTLWDFLSDKCPCPHGCTKTGISFTQTSEVFGWCPGAIPGKHTGVFTSTCSCP